MNLLCAVLIHLWAAGWLLAMARAYRKTRTLAAVPAPTITSAFGVAGR